MRCRMSCSADAPLPCGYRPAPIAFAAFALWLSPPYGFRPPWLATSPNDVRWLRALACPGLSWPVLSCPGLSSALNRGLCPVPSPVLSFFVSSMLFFALLLYLLVSLLVGFLLLCLSACNLAARWMLAARLSWSVGLSGFSPLRSSRHEKNESDDRSCAEWGQITVSFTLLPVCRTTVAG